MHASVSWIQCGRGDDDQVVSGLGGVVTAIGSCSKSIDAGIDFTRRALFGICKIVLVALGATEKAQQR
jgi:hypothetical protein